MKFTTYLNDKAKILVGRMHPKLANNYKEVKEMLLREFKLSPAVYLDKFNTDTRKQDETCLLYSARLVAILVFLDAYLDSRNIDQSYEKLTSLLVCDRIKSALPEACLKHILANESSKPDGWLQTHELAEAVDLYFANRWQHNDRPRVGALGVPCSTKPGGYGATVNRSGFTAKTAGNPNDNQKAIHTHFSSASKELTRRCFICGSKSHLKNECPERSKAHASRSNAKVSTCQVQERQEFVGGHTPVVSEVIQSREMKDAEVQVCAEPCLFDDDLIGEMTVDVNNVSNECQPVDSYDYAKLQYVDVKITDQNHSDAKVVAGLNDGGAEISVIRTNVLDKLDVVHIGKVKLRGIVGSPVDAALVKVNVALSNSTDDSDYVSVLCAVCPEANDDLVLTSNVVDSLFIACHFQLHWR